MTVMIVLSDCPPKLRGDMTKWFAEINTGVYVGNINARVRDEIWERIIDNIGHGHATMVFSSGGEQHLDFRVHNSYWNIVDLDGIKLIQRPARSVDEDNASALNPGFSTASKRKMSSHHNFSKLSSFFADEYVVLDLETTGLNEKKDEMIEMAALLVENGNVTEKFNYFVKCSGEIPVEITKLTGITKERTDKQGLSLEEALPKLREFADGLPFVSHNARFEKRFLDNSCMRIKEDEFDNRFIDTLEMAKLLLPGLGSYKLSALADKLDIPTDETHHALSDCETAFGVYSKLKEIAFEIIKK